MHRFLLPSVLLVVTLTLGASTIDEPKRKQDPPTSPAPSSPDRPEPLPADGIANFYRLSPDLYSGGQPEGEAGFRELEQRGIKTIITVDGATPDVETAQRYGLRYVHLPIGYDGVPRDQAVAIVKAMKTLTGPVFVHCHHGKHRGPTAAALCAIATEGWDRDAALDWLNEAGTSPDYAGLFETVRTFTPPSPAELAHAPDDLPERAEVPDLVDAMVAIDARWDHLKAIAAADYRTPPDQPDLDPPHEALMLAEYFRELRRLDEPQRLGPAFLDRLSTAERHALALRDALDSYSTSPTEPHRLSAETAFTTAARDCKACHATFRN